MEGIYLFSLTATDNKPASSSDTLVITVLAAPNNPPVANASADNTITLPTNSVTLTGTDTDGTITTYSWAKVSGPTGGSITTPAASTTTVTGLTAGSYIYRLTITDNKGATASDEVGITVYSAPAPVVTTQYINVNIYGGTNAYVSTSWNNWNIKNKTATNINASYFKYSNGSTSTITATLSNSTGIADNGSTYGSGMAPAQVLRYTSYYTGNRSLTIKGLSATKKYTIELYASRNVSGSSTIFTINGVSQTVVTYKNLITKVSFSNLGANAYGQIVINIAKTGSFNCVNRFTLSEISTTSTATARNNSLQSLEKVNTASLIERLEITPNPATHNLVFHITNKRTGLMKVDFIDVSGQVIKSMQLQKNSDRTQHSIAISELINGIYVIRIQLENWVSSKTFIKL